ncbi:MAG: GIY-YIG nuclease family protein [candidate division Zixibacteria bacterium]|nr:GIY-YIG nuclease family protein [candidate division Zixibacteria bacterium]
MHDYYVYILASRRNGTLYVGMSRDLVVRVAEHKSGAVDGFTRKYKVNMLVYFEHFEDAYEAVKRERQLKKWKREWKLELIERENPYWRDLYPDICP